MSEFDTLNFFSDEALIADPYTYYADKRSQCPVNVDPQQGLMALTGYDAAMSVYRDVEGFSACNSVIGPFSGLPFEPTGDDITDQIKQHRDEMPLSDYMPTLDPPRHTEVRGLLSKLMTPRRLKENEEFMWMLADRTLDGFVDAGECEFVGQYARPSALLVIADLLGVPAEDHPAFLDHLAGQVSGLAENQTFEHNPFEFLENQFTAYIEDRRREPRGDVLTQLAQATYPDGSTPEVIELVHHATFLFVAGQETTSKLLTFAIQLLGERPDLQQQLRDDPSLIPNFIEELLRFESPIKSHFRLVSKTTTIAGQRIPAGTTILMLPGAANRDPAHFADPDEFRIDRPNVREHVAFGRGIHTCPGAPLTRVEACVSLERVLSRMADIRISEAHHGPADARRYTYEKPFMMRGITELHIEFTPVT
ncbi:cytochrome P450 [Mycobacterium sp.]|uniref:cytochrome P450 n=1 Tax=Mycobacterium sp. TaxID=1785 RepID=UPI003C726D61